MIIKELSFSAFSKIFKEHDDLFVGIGFTKHGTVSVLLTPTVTWHIVKHAGIGGKVVVSNDESEEHPAHVITLDADDFDEITIC